jgi:hypothetical protein
MLERVKMMSNGTMRSCVCGTRIVVSVVPCASLGEFDIIGYTVFQNFLRIRFERDGLPASIATNFEGFIPVLQGMANDNPLKLKFQQAYAWGLRMLFATSTGIGFVGLLFTLTIGEYPLVRPFIPEHRLRK